MTPQHDDAFRDYTRGLFGRPSLAEEAAAAEAEGSNPDPNAGGVAPSEGRTSEPPRDTAREYARELFRRAQQQGGPDGW